MNIFIVLKPEVNVHLSRNQKQNFSFAFDGVIKNVFNS